MKNKQTTTEFIKANFPTAPCKKLAISNIVFPKWSDIGLMGLMFRQMLKTKEQPDGHIYDEAEFQTVLRILGGKVLMEGRPDCYAWKFEKLEKASSVQAIGTNTAEGLINLSEILLSVKDSKERSMLADMFANMNKDLLLVTLPEEYREYIEVTPEAYAAGLTYCVDNWMNPDENGEAQETLLNIGDFLIVEKKGVYCIRREEFLLTHSR